MRRCKCGGMTEYDCDNCGHEWLTCDKCKFEIETYESLDCYAEWDEAMKTYCLSQDSAEEIVKNLDGVVVRCENVDCLPFVARQKAPEEGVIGEMVECPDCKTK
ncbi:hypothetical protein [Vibrio rotiferianus]|uniref:hypothetical protein n=1 Tax=Vibrio rotiferianus TaxID=190895 RepID=UPI002894B1D7|nr:hypothetical protein THOE12_20773 [Vibrio rotiferianus]